MDILDAALGVSMENDGESKVEREYEIYGRLVDMEGLKHADSTEKQEQWGLVIEKTDQNSAFGTIRVRSINDGERYVLTSKIKHQDGNEEVEEETSSARFEQFRRLASTGLKKIRHMFKVSDDLTFEVDVFLDNNDNPQPWVKIDLEVPDGFNIEDFPDLPIDLHDARVIRPGLKNDEDLQYVRALFDEFFNLKNRYL